MNRDTLHLSLLRWAAGGVLALAAVIAGCGGGVGIGGTGAYASGPITGFGSIFVNGIEFGDDTARVEDDDGGGSSRDALRLGMMVEVESGPIVGSSTAPTASATRIRYASEIVGPVDANPGSGTGLTVFGQSVAVTSTTVQEPAVGGIAVGSTVAVYGFYDASLSRFVATRIEARSGTPLVFRLRGPVADLDTGARSFRIGASSFDYTGLTPPAGFQNGSTVQLTTGTSATNGRWRVLSFGNGVRRLPDLDDHLRGLVTARSSSRLFSINGQPVDASAASFPDGEAGIVLGARVEAEGSVSAGVLRATKVELDDDGGVQGGFELRGAIQNTFPALRTFVLRGVAVIYTANTEFQDGNAANLTVGRQVEARGVLSADGTKLLATRIRFR